MWAIMVYTMGSMVLLAEVGSGSGSFFFLNRIESIKGNRQGERGVYIVIVRL